MLAGMSRIDHDRLFKELLGTFFADFVALFLPAVAEGWEPDTLIRLDKELYHDTAAGERLEADLVVKARFKEQETFFIVHVEHQAQAVRNLPERMFRYYTRLSEKHRLPVYPVALLSYPGPRKPAPSVYEAAFLGRRVLRFEYDVIQLNRLDWRDFQGCKNPVASALMSRMAFEKEEQEEVAKACFRTLLGLKLNPAQIHLISGFVDTYTPVGLEAIEEVLEESPELSAGEKERLMLELSNPWIRHGLEKGHVQGLAEGRAKGLAEGRAEGLAQGLAEGLAEGLTEGRKAGLTEGRQAGELSLALRLLEKRFGKLGKARTARIRALELERLEAIVEAIFEIDGLKALDERLAQG